MKSISVYSINMYNIIVKHHVQRRREITPTLRSINKVSIKGTSTNKVLIKGTSRN